MIQGITTGAGGSALGRHLADFKGQNDETRPGLSRGLLAETTAEQIRELSQLAGASRSRKPVAHFHADPDPLTPWNDEQWEAHWKRVEDEFGLTRQPFAEAIHVKDGREHRHRAYSLYDPTTGNTIRLEHYKRRNEKLSRLAEFENGHRLIKGKHNRAVAHALEKDGRADVAMAITSAGLTDGPPAIAKLTPEQRHQQERTGIRKQDVAAAAAMAWASSDNPQAFAAALRDSGLILAQGDKVPVIVDGAGNVHALARMLAMSARADGTEAPKSADVHARLRGVELPSLDDARARVAQVPEPVQAAPDVTPDPPQPDGGEPVQVIELPAPQDAQSPSVPDVATPSNDGGAQMPAAASAPAAPKAAGGGGGGSSPSHSEQSSPLPSLDVGRGPGEPPGPGAHPDEIARHAAAVADYQERKEKAWLAFIRAFEAQNKPKSRGTTTGGGDNGIDEKALRERASEIIRSIEDATERAITLKSFYAAWDQFRNDQAATPGLGNPGEGTPRPDEIHGPGRGNRERAHGEDGPAQRGRIPERDNGTPGGRGDGHQDAERDERTPRPHRTAFEIAVERTQRDMSASIADMSDLRAEMRGPCPLEGLEGAARKAKLDELNKELHAEFRASQREDFSEQLARERMRAHPLAQALRALPRRNLTPGQEQQRQQGWADIKKAHAALVTRLKEAQKANQKAGFLQFLEFRSLTDSRALAVFEDMKAKAERARKIRAELAKGDARVAELRSSEPQGERDPDKAAQAAKTALYDRLREAQDQVKEAQKNLSEAPQPWKVTRWIAAVGFTVESVKHRVSAEQALERAMTHEKAVTPHYLDIDAATGKARNAAVQTERAHSVWRAGPGAELATLEPRMAEIHAAVDRRDWRITEALATKGIDTALDEVRKREEREERKLREEARKAEYGARMANRGQVVEFPGSAGPRMR